MFIFGSGHLIGTPLTDGNGVAITNPSPIQLGTIQSVSVNLSSDIKTLYGNLQFPVAAGRGQGTATITAQFARINGALMSAFVFGQSLTTGSFTSHIDSVGQAIPATPFTVTIDPPAADLYGYDLGVQDGLGVAYTRVASGPVTGQYSVDTATGIYTFAAADTGKTVFISYSHSNAATYKKMTIANLPMGYAPSMQLDQHVSYQGKSMTIRWPNVISNGLTFDFTNDDFSIPEMEFSAFADANGNIAYMSLSE